MTADVSPRLRTRLVLPVLALALLLVPAQARAEFEILPGSFTADTFRADGSRETRAGVHPYAATTSFDFPRNADGYIEEYPRDLRFKLPPGFVGNPEATVKCARPTFNAIITDPEGAACPAGSQVGAARIRVPLFGFEQVFHVPVYNLETPDGRTAHLGIPVLTVPVIVEATVDTAGDYGLDIRLTKMSQGLPVSGTTMTLWGVPADPAHDAERACGGPNIFGTLCPVDDPRTPFLTNPMTCGEPQTSTMTAASWADPADVKHASYAAPPLEGCEDLRFAPEVHVKAASEAAGEPTGLDVGIELPQEDQQNGLAPATLRDVKLTLPDGMAISAATADGLGACGDAELGLGNTEPVRCADASKIGTVTAESPLLPGPLTGEVYQRTQNSSDPASGEMFRLALVLRHEQRGLLIKLAGRVAADPATGRVTTTFAANPPLPMSRFDLRLKTGARAPLTNPPACGMHVARAELTSWASATPVVSESSLPVAGGCDAIGGFSPSLSAGVVNPQGGASSPFVVDLTRPAGQLPMTGVDVALPEGLLARIKDVPRCPEDRAATGACDAASRVGSVTIAAGAGSNPIHLPQAGKAPTAAYLAGPYKGAPYSLSIVVPAQAGPFDLGTVVVRAALHVDPITTRVSVISDPLPTILKGVPLDVRRVRIDMDRPGFMINPTDCAEQRVSGTVRSAAGRSGAAAVDGAGAGYATAAGPSASVASRFQAAGCAGLPLRPGLSMALTGKGETTDGEHPGVRAVLTQPAGGSNLDAVQVKLPLSLALDPDNAQALCEFADGSKVTPTCPEGSIVGRATAVTPILGVPLTGPVYFVKNVRITKSGGRARTLPKIVIPLEGDGVKLTLTGVSSVEEDHLVTTFENVPDAPVSRFELNIDGGEHGILAVTGGARADICKSNQVARREIDGQNGGMADARVYIATPACPFRVLRREVSRRSISVKLGGLGPGRLTVRGPGVRRTSKRIARGTIATIVAPRRGDRSTRVIVSFDPAGKARPKTIRSG